MKQHWLILTGAATLIACADFDPPTHAGVTSPPDRPAHELVPAPSEEHALAISSTIQERHWPYLTLLNPRYASGDPESPDYWVLGPTGYTQAADNAIWTGHYLAAEAFRHKVTGSPDALTNARRAVEGLSALTEVTGTDVLARFLIPADFEYAEPVLAEETRHGIYAATYRGKAHYWLGNTSRDQYSGAFFGLGVAFSMIDDPATRTEIRTVVSRMLDYLIRTDWAVRMPDGTTSTTFKGRADQQLSFLQVGRLVDPAKWDRTYKSYRSKLHSSVGTPISLECSDPHGSYYKFNLNHINLFNLIRLEEPGTPYNSYMKAFNTLRNCTGSHRNAHFNLIERGLKGANATRDAATREFLGLWLLRARRDYFVDNSQEYEACGDNRSCEVIAIEKRYNTDFLWQRSPFQLWGGVDGTTATPAVDYVLPYWMGRYYGVLTQ